MTTPHTFDPSDPTSTSAEPSYRDGHRIHDRFTIRSFEGAGALGERYLAFDEEVDVVVALRVVHAGLLPDEAARRQFQERMQRARSLSHSSLLRVYAVIEHEGRQVLAVQHAPGRSLAAGTSFGTVTSFVDARPILGQVAAALAHAHHLGIVLGDLRPSTVMTLPEGVKVTSVGVALALPRDRYLAALKNHPELYHLAPELRHGDPCDARADVFSFAALAITLLAGSDVTSARAGLRPDLPAPLVTALERAFDEDPGKRYATVEALLSAIDRGAQSSKRGGPVTLPASMSAAAGPSDKNDKPEKNENDRTSRRPAPSPPSLRTTPVRVSGGDVRRDVTRQVDEEELKRLAGEVSELLETTRQVSVDEMMPLRAQSAETTRGGERDGASRVPMPVGREPSQKRRDERANATSRERPAPAPVIEVRRGLIEEDDDLEFDLGQTIRIEKVDEPTRTDGPLAKLPTAEDWLMASDSGSPPVSDRKAVAFDPLAGLDDVDDIGAPRQAQSKPELHFQPTSDPFSAALEAASGDESPFLLTQGHRRSGPGEARNDAGLVEIAAIPAPATAAPVPSRRASEAVHANPPIDLDTSGIVEELHVVTTRGRAAYDRAESESATRPSAPPPTQRMPAPDFFPASAFIAEHPPGNRTAAPALSASTAPTMPAVAGDGLVPAASRPLALALAVPVAVPVPATLRRPKQVRTDGRLIIIGGICMALALAALVALAVRFTKQNEPPVAPLPTSATATSTAVVGSPPSRPAVPPRSAPALPVGGITGVAPTGPAATGAPPPSAPTIAPGGPAPTGGTTGAPSAVAATVLVPGCPAGMVHLDGSTPACIDSHEFPGAGQLPRTGVSLVEAGKLCADRGARLCASREWERACRGTGGASYPYGQRYLPDTCNTDGTLLKPGGSLEGCRSRIGAFDMSGNAAEWTASGIIKGGAAGQGNPAGRCSHDQRSGEVGLDLVGFRCCADSH